MALRKKTETTKSGKSSKSNAPNPFEKYIKKDGDISEKPKRRIKGFVENSEDNDSKNRRPRIASRANDGKNKSDFEKREAARKKRESRSYDSSKRYSSNSDDYSFPFKTATNERFHSEKNFNNDKPFPFKENKGDDWSLERKGSRSSSRKEHSSSDYGNKKKSFEPRNNNKSGFEPKRTFEKKYEDNQKPYSKRTNFDRPSFDDKKSYSKKPFSDREAYNQKPFDKKPYHDDQFDSKKTFNKNSYKDQPRFSEPVKKSRTKLGDNFFERNNDYQERKSGRYQDGNHRSTLKNDKYADEKQNIFNRRDSDYGKSKNSVKEPGSGEMWLSKYIAQCGICSRRKAADFIKSGHIRVNGVVELNPAYVVKSNDTITQGKEELIREEKLIYLLMNKPKNVITTADDEKGRRTIIDLVKDEYKERLFPVGRLDRNTTGLILLTNDGALAEKLSHPSHLIKKVYHVILDKNLKLKDLEKIREGLNLEDGLIEVDAINYIEDKNKNEIGIELHSGKNRIVRRIFESLGYIVDKLDRTLYAGLTKKDLPRGYYRELDQKEVMMLRHFTNMRKKG